MRVQACEETEKSSLFPANVTQEKQTSGPIAEAVPSQGGEAVLRFGGEWGPGATAPTAEVIEQLGLAGAATPGSESNGTSSAAPKKVRFEPTDDDTDYNSHLLAFLAAIATACSAAQVDWDIEAIPDGPKRLLALSRTVPVREEPKFDHHKEGFFFTVGAAGLTFYEEIREFLEFMGSIFLQTIALFRNRRQFRSKDMWTILRECSADALPIVTLISFLVGMIIAFVGGVQLQKFGASIYMVDLVGIAMTREMGAIMTGVILSGRTGAAFAAHIGTMKVNQEVDALRIDDISPMGFLALPRVLALVAIMPLMVVYSDFVSILGGWVVGLTLDIPTPLYFQRLFEVVSLTNCGIGVVKGFVFGAIIASAGCLRGLQCGRNAAAVGKATTSAVVTAITGIIVLDALFAVLLSVLDI